MELGKWRGGREQEGEGGRDGEVKGGLDLLAGNKKRKLRN
jgi:hypothetical protein